MAWIKDISLNADTDATVKLIVETTNDFYNSKKQREILAKITEGKTVPLDEFLQRIFYFAYHSFPYKMDEPGWEKIYTPDKILNDGRFGIDCKKFTVFLGALMKIVGVKYFWKVVSYDYGIHWSHIYLIVPISEKKYITLDPVNLGKYNTEVEHDKARLYTSETNYLLMNGNRLSQMGNLPFNLSGMKGGIGTSVTNIEDDLLAISGMKGLGCNCLMGDEEMFNLSGINMMDATEYGDYLGRCEGMGRRKPKKTKEERKERRKEIFKKGKKLGFAPNRAAFLGLLALGRALEHTPIKINLAAKLADLYIRNPGLVKKAWEGFGGKMEALKKALEKSTHQKLNGIGVVTAAAAAAAIVAATPIVVVIVKLLKENGILKGQAAETADKVVDTIEDLHMDNGTPEASAAPQVTQEQIRVIPGTNDVKVMTSPTNNQVIDDGADTERVVLSNANSMPNANNAPSQNTDTTTDNTVAPTQGSLLDFNNLLSINTWLKGWGLFGLMGGMGRWFSPTTNVISSLCFLMLIFCIIYQTKNSLTKKKRNEIQF